MTNHYRDRRGSLKLLVLVAAVLTGVVVPARVYVVGRSPAQIPSVSLGDRALTFETASVKPNRSGETRSSNSIQPGGGILRRTCHCDN
jgi:hypothetical protein